MLSTVAPSSTAKGQAARPGPSGVRTLLTIGAFAVLFAALGYGIFGLVQPRHPKTGTVPHYPHPVEQTLTGTYASPALTIVGDYVQVKAPTFSVLALVTGPLVPGEGLPNQMGFDTCTWTVSFSHVVGRAPVAVADFDSIDHLGTVFKPYLVPGQPKLPKFVLPGHKLSFQIRAIMPVGEGLMRWAPNGNNIIAKWDYQVEND
jgi:hypothetical protein